MTGKLQYSLGSLLAVVTLVAVGLGIGIPAFHAAARVEWADPILGWGLGFMGLVAAVVLAIVTLRR